MAHITEHFFDDKAAMTAALSRALETILSDAVAKKGRASMMVSGGSSPKPTYEYLSQQPLPWDSIDVAMVDERWVAPSHEKSNEQFIKQTLLQDKAKNTRFVTMKTEHNTAKEAADAVNKAYQALVAPYTVTLLGMGPDGHTASLFPHCEGLNHALTTQEPVCAINAIESDVTGSITERMTLSLSGIANSHVVKLLISGDEKRAVYEACKQDGPVADMPLRAVLTHPDIKLEVYWCP